MPPTPSVTLTDRDSVAGLLSEFGVRLQADDDADGDTDDEEEAFIATAIKIGSATVLRYCQPGYDTADLATSVSAWDWATVIAAARLCGRRANPVPEELVARRDEAMDELRAVLKGELPIEDIGKRVTDGPAWSNVVVDPRYRGRQIRVQRRQSEQTPRERPPARDWPDEVLGAEEPFGGG